jgi:hypothetical protein
MYTFYAQISAPQSSGETFLSTLASLTRLSCKQMRLIASRQVWNTWDT